MPTGHPLWPTIAKAFAEKKSQFEHPANVLFIHTQENREVAISVTPPWPLAQIQRDLLEVFCQRIAAAFDNLYMFGQLRKAQEATVVALADLAEFRDSGTGGHVRRVQMLSSSLANRLAERGAYADEITPQLLEMIGLASILHDVGKVATPDHILLKPDHPHAGRAGRDADPRGGRQIDPGARRQHGRRRQLPDLRRRDRRRPPRALRRQRLSEPAGGARDSDLGAHRRGGRRVRFAAARASVQGAVAAHRGDDLHSPTAPASSSIPRSSPRCWT
jgi:hypothetical protein